MAQKYYNSEKAAEALGIAQDEILAMVQRQELHGYRDGADWKFRAEDIERLMQERAAEQPREPSPSESDVLLSELELGPSASSASGTVIGGVQEPGATADSDIQLDAANGSSAGRDELDSKVADFEELDLTLEEDLSLEDSGVGTSAEPGPGGSAVDLTGKNLEDDDVVLGGSGTGSDITIGGDSGISLVDPTDSGLSLEDPLDMGGGGDESLEMGEDEMVTLSEEVDSESPTELKTDDDFLLTPLEEVGEDEESESGSQVIALGTEEESDESSSAVAAGPSESGVTAMLDEDLGAAAGADVGLAAPVGAAAMEATPLEAQPGAFAEGAPLPQSAVAALPEAPYSIWNILSLALCTFFLILVGMMMYDLMRNMWSWNSPYPVNSWIMDTILGR